MKKQETEQPQLMSKNAYAKYLGIDESAVRKAINTGKIVNGFDTVKKKIIVKIADKEFGFSHQVLKGRAGVSRAKTAEKITQSQNTNQAKVATPKSEKTVKNSDSPKSEKSKSEDEEEFDIPLEYAGVPVADLLKQIVLHQGLPYNESLRLKMLLDVCHEKQRLELQQGTLVKREDVAKVLYAVGAQLKKAIKAMPARIVANVRVSDSDAAGRLIMDEEIDTILTHYANLESVDLAKH